MTRFVFTAHDENEERVSGTIDAKDQKAAIKILSQQNLLVTRIATLKERRKKFLLWGPKFYVSGEDLLAFTQQAATLVESGIPLKKAMDFIAEDTENPDLRRIIVEISAGLAAGNSLLGLLSQYPEVFSPLYLSFVEVGEKGGILPDNLARLAAYLENADIMSRKVKGALYYPAMILIFALFMLIFVFSFGIPEIEPIYAGLGSELPLPTRAILAIGNFLSRSWIYLFFLLLAAVISFVRFARTPGGIKFIDTFKLRIPLWGPIYEKLAISRFARALGSLYGSGHPIAQAYPLLSKTLGNQVIEEEVIKSLEGVRYGKTITNCLRKVRFFPGIAIGMISSGEESGNLDRMLAKLADFYDAQLDSIIKTITRLLEPVMMIVVGIVIALILLGMGLPFLNVMSALKLG